MPLNARHCAEWYSQLAYRASGSGAYTLICIALNRAGEGEDRKHGPKTRNQCMLIQFVVSSWWVLNQRM